ncbi:vWA domain-containing protein [Streptomyces longwoodensis]|uniref:vWA domain-containing protein n=1 Tax=Streptomyces longwoodensis TaxID=68231 RepID=UPI0033F1B04B
MARLPRHTGFACARLRRSARALAVALAAGVLLAGPQAAANPAAPGRSDGLDALLDDLTARQGADYAVLIDTSSSMETGRYYPQVRTVLPAFLDALSDLDRVCLVPFGYGAGNCDLVPPEQARKDLQDLPEHADGGASNLGLAFDSAFDGLRRGRNATAGVLLLSDAVLNAPPDSAYSKLSSTGWSTLRKKAAALPAAANLTGYGVPFGPGGHVEQVLRTVLPRYQMLDPSHDDLRSRLAEAHDDTRIRQARQAVTADRDKGVLVSWPDSTRRTSAPGPVRMRLTATTASLPVRVSGLALGGLPAGVHVTSGLPARIDLRPGQQHTFTVTLSTDRQQRSGLRPGTRRTVWRLSVRGNVTSPLAADVHTYLAGTDAALAGHPDGPDLAMAGSVRTHASPWLWALIALAVLLLIALGVRYLPRFGRPNGTLVAEGVDGTVVPFRLGGRTSVHRVDGLVEGSGTVEVIRLPVQRGQEPALRLRCRIDGREAREAVCRPGRTELLCGIEFRYDTPRT